MVNIDIKTFMLVWEGLLHMLASQLSLQGAALCWQAMQVAVICWQTDSSGSQAGLELLGTIINNASRLVGHEMWPQLSKLGGPLPSLAVDDMQLAGSLLLGHHTHQRCSLDQLQARWGHQ